MLPALLTSPRKLATLGIAAALASTLASAPAMAWGVKEQQFLAGAASTLLLEGIFAPQMFQSKSQPSYHGSQGYYRPAPPQPVYYSPPVYSTPSIYDTPLATSFNSYSEDYRRRIQSTLAGFGYYHGTIDGSFGPATYNALTAYATTTHKQGLLSTQAGAYTLFDSLLS